MAHNQAGRSPIVYILTGETGSGKTTYLLNLVEKLRNRKLSISGFAAPAKREKGSPRSYEILDITTGKRLSLTTPLFREGWIKAGNFYFNPAGIEAGNRILEKSGLRGTDLLIIDEIGPFELEDKIWAYAINRLIKTPCCSMIWVVRRALVDQVVEKWKLQDAVIIDIGKVLTGQAEEMILAGQRKA